MAADPLRRALLLFAGARRQTPAQWMAIVGRQTIGRRHKVGLLGGPPNDHLKPQSSELTTRRGPTPQPPATDIPSRGRNVVVELSIVPAEAQSEETEEWAAGAAEAAGGALEQVAPACEPSQRLLAARERSEICFWFQIEPQLKRKIGDDLPEQLVEAELHVFKLLPEAAAEPAGRAKVSSTGDRFVREAGSLLRNRKLAAARTN